MSRGAGPERATTSEGYYYQRSRVIHPPPNLRWGVPVSGRRDDGCRSPDYVAGSFSRAPGLTQKAGAVNMGSWGTYASIRCRVALAHINC